MSLSEQDQQYLDRTFTYHLPVGDQRERYTAIRDQARQFAELLLTTCPSSRERSLALTQLELVVMWANASIARSGSGQ